MIIFNPVANFGHHPLDQKSRQQALRAYCHNIYTVVVGSVKSYSVWSNTDLSMTMSNKVKPI